MWLLQLEETTNGLNLKAFVMMDIAEKPGKRCGQNGSGAEVVVHDGAFVERVSVTFLRQYFRNRSVTVVNEFREIGVRGISAWGRQTTFSASVAEEIGQNECWESDSKQILSFEINFLKFNRVSTFV